MAEDLTVTEEKLLGLLLSNKEVCKLWQTEKLTEKYFSKKYHNLLSGIDYSLNEDVLLTKFSYQNFLKSYKNSLTHAEVVSEIAIHGSCLMNAAKKDDFPVLKSLIKENYTQKQTNKAFSEYQKDKEKSNIIEANKKLIDKLSELEVENSTEEIEIVDLGEKEDFIKFKQEIENKINNPKSILKCGITEIDKTMQIGFEIGHLTTFVADVGNFKTTMMANISFNIFNLSGQDANVLYIPLEMSAQEIRDKVLCRETGINSEKLKNPTDLTEAEKEILFKKMEEFQSFNNKYRILEFKSRTKVSSIRKQIEKEISYIKPRIVVVDYADKLKPENNLSRNDLEIEEILMDLRYMGKTLGFHIISAAQMGRDAIKKIRDSNDAKPSSADIRGGQVIAAVSDTVYSQWVNPKNPKEELFFSCIKSRHGTNIFPNNSSKTILKIRPEISLIYSPENSDLKWNSFSENQNKALLKNLETAPPSGIISGYSSDEDPFST